MWVSGSVREGFRDKNGFVQDKPINGLHHVGQSWCFEYWQQAEEVIRSHGGDLFGIPFVMHIAYPTHTHCKHITFGQNRSWSQDNNIQNDSMIPFY